MSKLRRSKVAGEELPALGPEEEAAAGLAPAPGGEHAWGRLAISVARFAATVAELPGGGASVDAAVDVLHALRGVQDAQTTLLQSLKEEVELLRAAPYKSAALLMSEAARVGPGDERYGKFLEDASMQLYQAHPLCESVEEEAVVEFHLGLVYMLLGSSTDASYWLLESSRSGRKVLDELASRAGDVKIVKHKSVAALATVSSVALWPLAVPAGAALLVKRHKKQVASKAAAATVEQLVPFVNTTADCYNSLGPQEKVPTITISRDRRGHLLLEEGAVSA